MIDATQAVDFENSPLDTCVAAERASGLVAGPMRMQVVDNKATARREIWLRARLHEIAPALDPRTWPLRNRFFAHTEKLEEPVDPGPPGETSWRGRVLEIFRLDVGTVRLNRFEVILDIDISVEADVVRMDYALVHEKGNKLTVDDGYVMARKVAGHPGWTHVAAEKTVAFQSSLAALVAPSAIVLLSQEDPTRFWRATLETQT